MKSVTVEITGTTPLLMHADNIEWADRMEAWKNNSKNKAKSKPGDDRTPPWRWVGCLYHDGEVITMRSENIMRCIMEGAAQVPTGKGQKTFKAQSQSGLFCAEFDWPLRINSNVIRMDDINALLDDEFTFKDHMETVAKLGFSLNVKRARIKNAKHIRVRPQFDNWSAIGEINITDDQITKEILGNILEIAGRYKGLCDWRPGAKTPGPWGMFKAEIH